MADFKIGNGILFQDAGRFWHDSAGWMAVWPKENKFHWRFSLTGEEGPLFETKEAAAEAGYAWLKARVDRIAEHI